mmetsp:Transcript_117024/g.342752  ORF Transcript_117024/g.342752 Transcript_117024/m.342752 type:complete len:371 (-) Transcript_117024:147-1259(-)
MGASAACCVKRDSDGKEILERRNSWQSVNDPDDFLTFFDCVEGDEAPQDQVSVRRTGSFEVVSLRKPTWQALGGGRADAVQCAQHLEAVPESPCAAAEPVDEDAVHRVAGSTRERWLDRSSGGDLDEELCQRLRQGFPELEEWTAPSTVRRMLRAACGDEAQAAEILDKAINCRVRRRVLFQTMRCPLTCDARVIGMDLQRRPVVYINTSSQIAPLSEMLPQLFLSFEAAVRIGHPEGQIVLIADMTGLKVRLNMDRHAVREFSDSFGTVFADRLNFILVVDFSFVAQTLWSLCQPFMSERTRSKIQFVNEEQARRACRERLTRGTCERALSALDIYRDTTSTPAEREAHAKRTSICDVPLGIPAVNEAG